MKPVPARRHILALFHAIFFTVGLLAQGCDEHGGHDGEEAGNKAHDGHEHSEESGDTLAAYVPGHGLKLAHEVTEAIGLQTTQAAIHTINRVLVFQAHALDANRAVAIIHGESLADIHPGQLFAINGTEANARLLSISLSTQKATGLAELVLEIPPIHTGNSTSKTLGNLTLTHAIPPSTGVAIPRKALLETATGTFVYAVVDGHYRRTPVRTGLGDATHVLIQSGLSIDDLIVTAPVEQLWLVELRLTKGGGHSH